MSRYIGPLWRKSRSLGFSLLGNKKEFSRRDKNKEKTSSFGQRGTKKKRLSTYALQNREKQRLRFLYGLREKQLFNLFAKLKRTRGNVNESLLKSLESRFDNLVFRSGLVGTLRMARQLVNHGHFLLNGQKVDIPSYEVKPESVIILKKPFMKENKIIKSMLEQNILPPSYINLDKQNMVITYLRYPSTEELNKKININVPLVAE